MHEKLGVDTPGFIIITSVTGCNAKNGLLDYDSIDLVMIHLPQLYSLDCNAICYIYLPWRWNLKASCQNHTVELR